MKNKIIMGALIVGTIGVGVTSVSAFTNQSKVDKLAELTNKSTEEIISEKETSDKTYGQIASENGVLEEFKKFNYETKKLMIQEKVDNGSITQEEADRLMIAIEERMQNCDGTGANRGEGMRLGLGLGNGYGRGHHQQNRNH